MIEPRIFQINVSGGGVPKVAVREATVTRLGLSGDHQNNQVLHGGPERALCLYSLEQIRALQAEGHPIYPGSIGENLTLSGLAWDQITPGTQLLLGGNVRIEITSYTSPCSKIADSFKGKEFIRASQDAHPSWSRVYARVLSVGRIRTGEPVQLLPESESLADTQAAPSSDKS